MDLPHKTEKVILKSADIDIGIIPVVKWLNEFDGLLTLYSCQGEDRKTPDGDSYPPYIVFMCFRMHAIHDINSIITECNDSNEKYSIMLDFGTPLVNKVKLSSTFHMSWNDTDSLNYFIKFLDEKLKTTKENNEEETRTNKNCSILS